MALFCCLQRDIVHFICWPPIIFVSLQFCVSFHFCLFYLFLLLLLLWAGGVKVGRDMHSNSSATQHQRRRRQRQRHRRLRINVSHHSQHQQTSDQWANTTPTWAVATRCLTSTWPGRFAWRLCWAQAEVVWEGKCNARFCLWTETGFGCKWII